MGVNFVSGGGGGQTAVFKTMLSMRTLSSAVVSLAVCFCSGALLGWQATKQMESIESEIRLFIRCKNNEKMDMG
jgi:hypothetical protein